MSSPTLQTELHWTAEQEGGFFHLRESRCYVPREPDELIVHVRICVGLAGYHLPYPEDSFKKRAR